MNKVATTADRLKTIMHNRDIRQIDIAQITGIHKGTISHYITGRLVPKSDAIVKMSSTLGVSELWLMGYDVPMTVEVDPETVRNQAIADIALRMQTDDRYRDVVIRLDKLDRKKLDAVAAIVESMQ
nr:MAG TPA: bifunctional HTH-domain containing protein/aminotransferase [Caudoviricetes sp.]